MVTATLSATIWEEPTGFVSLCPELGVTSCGDTADEALEMLREAVDLYVVNAMALGILEDARPAIESRTRTVRTFDVLLPWAS